METKMEAGPSLGNKPYGNYGGCKGVMGDPLSANVHYL